MYWPGLMFAVVGANSDVYTRDWPAGMAGKQEGTESLLVPTIHQQCFVLLSGNHNRSSFADALVNLLACVGAQIAIAILRR